jgi:hypothetical protein
MANPHELMQACIRGYEEYITYNVEWVVVDGQEEMNITMIGAHSVIVLQTKNAKVPEYKITNKVIHRMLYDNDNHFARHEPLFAIAKLHKLGYQADHKSALINKMIDVLDCMEGQQAIEINLTFEAYAPNVTCSTITVTCPYNNDISMDSVLAVELALYALQKDVCLKYTAADTSFISNVTWRIID